MYSTLPARGHQVGRWTLACGAIVGARYSDVNERSTFFVLTGEETIKLHVTTEPAI
jgi:hypothetical protein